MDDPRISTETGTEGRSSPDERASASLLFRRAFRNLDQGKSSFRGELEVLLGEGRGGVRSIERGASPCSPLAREGLGKARRVLGDSCSTRERMQPSLLSSSAKSSGGSEALPSALHRNLNGVHLRGPTGREEQGRSVRRKKPFQSSRYSPLSATIKRWSNKAAQEYKV